MRTSFEDDLFGKSDSWIRFACERNDVDELSQVILVEWNPQYTRQLGDAAYNSVTFPPDSFQETLVAQASEQLDRQTVIHETCHIIVGYPI